MSHLALHVCCAPCMIVPLDEMLRVYDRVTVVYANSNIHPQSEYELRRDFAREFAQRAGAEFVELPCDPTVWRAAIEGKDPRCEGCYEMRLTAVAQWAAQHGADEISTVMTISPYQDSELIARVGERVCAQHGVSYVSRIFVEMYPQSVTRSKEEGIYRQIYCGCALSLSESLDQRYNKKVRHEERERQKSKRRAEAEANRAKKQAQKERARAH